MKELTPKEIKEIAIKKLRKHVALQSEQLSEIDDRLLEYYHNLCKHSSTILGDDNDQHCLMELLGALKVLRLMRIYVVDVDKVQQVIRLREGDWHKDGKLWVYDRGGLLLPGTGNSMTHYRWEPFQIFIWTAIYGIKAWVDTEVENGSRQLLPTEREGIHGTIEDLRRLCTDFTLFGPRKIDKSGISAYNALLFFMLEDANSEIYCTANSSSQAKILFDRTRQMIHQLDPKERRIRFTAREVNWKQGQIRSATMSALSAGGKTKDGLYAQLCCADEYGSAPYVNGKSDMGALVSVVQSSMGPRREPLTVTTTTAGNISQGPFMEKLTAIKAGLLGEIDDKWDTVTNPSQRLLDPLDRWTCLLLEPDMWEQEDEEYLLTSRQLRRKINPMLGKIVQHSFYDDEISKSRLDAQKKAETITKLLNVYQSGRVVEWIKSDQVRAIQVERRVTDCLFRQGWQTFVGLDFGGIDDLFAISYLSVNMQPSAPMSGRFLADMDAWITEANLQKSPNRQLYEKWIEQGWLRVCPGEVFNPDYAISELMGKSNGGVNLAYFGYDPAQSKQPINTIKAWLQSIGIDAITIQEMVVPVAQTYMVFNGLIGELEYMMLSKEPWLNFSMSPLWPWQFGNARIEESREGNRKVLKASATQKVDNIHALIDALYCFDLSEGKVMHN